MPLGMIVAALGGLAIGVERQWSGHATGPRARFAGVRTFTLLGGIAGVAGWLWSIDAEALATVILASCGALVVAAYAAASRADVEATTEASAVVVLTAGTLAGLGYLTVSSGIVAATVLMLVEKTRLHAMVGRLDDKSLIAAARFAVMATVVLPLLPAGPYGPWGTIQPRALWVLVLVFSGISFVGYIAQRSVGARRGYLLAGLLGGLVSSTSVTFSFARASRDASRFQAPLAYGAVAACTLLFFRVAVVASLLNPGLLRPLLPYLAPPFVAGMAALAVGARHHRSGQAEAPEVSGNPLKLGAALQLALLFQVVLTAVELVRLGWGDIGVVLSGFVLGLTDVDALTISMARGATGLIPSIPLEVAARGVATGILANTLLKLMVGVMLGAPEFRRIAAASLGAMAAAAVAALLVQGS